MTVLIQINSLITAVHNMLILMTELAPQTSSLSVSDLNNFSQTQVNLFLNYNLEDN